MRFGILLLTLALALPAGAEAQSSRRPRDVERFEVSGLPKTQTSDLEKEIFLLLQVHKKGDLTDASRIHAKLGQYYREHGQSALSDACNQLAMAAWEQASGERSTSAGSPGTPPFEPRNTIARTFAYTDNDLKVEHTWDFFEDGTFAHVLTAESQPDTPGPREMGWYTIEKGRIRVFQFKPRVDKTFSFELLGEGGKEGALLDGTRMKAIP